MALQSRVTVVAIVEPSGPRARLASEYRRKIDVPDPETLAHLAHAFVGDLTVVPLGIGAKRNLPYVIVHLGQKRSKHLG